MTHSCHGVNMSENEKNDISQGCIIITQLSNSVHCILAIISSKIISRVGKY